MRHRSLSRRVARRTAPRFAGIAAAASVVVIAAARVAAAAPPPLRVDLDEFDRMKTSVVLPNGVTLAYVEFGKRQGPPVVLVHGYTDSARDWVPLVPYLDQASRLILVDLRGHGGSSKPECCYALVDFAYDVKLLLDKLQIERADIVGHSLGSIIAQTLAELWPERVHDVILISSTGASRGACQPPPVQSKTSAFDWHAEIAKLHDPIDPESPFMIAWYSSPTPVDEEFIRRQRRDAAAIPVQVWHAVLDEGLSDLNPQSTLPKLIAKTLLIWGGKDPIFGKCHRDALRKALPAATVKIFPALGHNPFWEDPVAVAAVINPFLHDDR
jgi:pimeloyl-ACP methyl ester carboxylesterase